MRKVYAQSATASMPVIGSSCTAPVADCPPLSRPHNLHYVEMPAARGFAPRACRCAGCLIAMVDPKSGGHTSHACPPLCAPTIRSRSLLAVQRSTVLAASRACGEWPKTATLDAAARDAGRAWPTALDVSR
jgi:hypothetical protein